MSRYSGGAAESQASKPVRGERKKKGQGVQVPEELLRARCEVAFPKLEIATSSSMFLNKKEATHQLCAQNQMMLLGAFVLDEAEGDDAVVSLRDTPTEIDLDMDTGRVLSFAPYAALRLALEIKNTDDDAAHLATLEAEKNK